VNKSFLSGQLITFGTYHRKTLILILWTFSLPPLDQ